MPQFAHIGDAVITYGIDATQHDPAMPHKIAVGVTITPSAHGTHVDTVWVAPMAHRTSDADIATEGYRVFLSFLGAAAEAYDYGMRTGDASENIDLFPPHITEWAYLNSDEIECAQLDMDDDDDDDDELPDTCLNTVDGHWYVVTYGRAPYRIHATDCATCETRGANL